MIILLQCNLHKFLYIKYIRLTVILNRGTVWVADIDKECTHLWILI